MKTFLSKSNLSKTSFIWFIGTSVRAFDEVRRASFPTEVSNRLSCIFEPMMRIYFFGNPTPALCACAVVRVDVQVGHELL